MKREGKVLVASSAGSACDDEMMMMMIAVSFVAFTRMEEGMFWSLDMAAQAK